MLYEVAGFAGVVCYLSAYAALQAGIIRGRGYVYPGINLAAAALIMTSLIGAFNLWSALVQVSFGVISLFGIARMYLINRRLRFSGEDEELMKALFPDTPRQTVRAFLDAGLWMDVDPGTYLTREGHAVERMVFLKSGAARVHSGDATLATVRAGHMLGEVGASQDKTASADVVVTQAARVFTIGAENLRKLIATDVDFRVHFERAMGRDNQGKLLATNAALHSQGGIPQETPSGEPPNA